MKRTILATIIIFACLIADAQGNRQLDSLRYILPEFTRGTVIFADKTVKSGVLNISPIVDMERIEGVTLDEEHLRYVRQHPIEWRVPTHILYGESDNLTSLATITDFAHRTGATLEVMPGGEH